MGSGGGGYGVKSGRFLRSEKIMCKNFSDGSVGGGGFWLFEEDGML